MSPIRSNRIGTNAAGTEPLHNLNNAAVLITAPGNVIDDNLISAVDAAIVAFTTRAVGNTFSRNDIGSNPALATKTGIHLLNSAADTLMIGNTIANGQRGIVLQNAGEGNDISGNSLFGNSQIGIDLHGDGQTANDQGDTDEGENRLQNTPVITAALLVGDSLEITYHVDSPTPGGSSPIRVELFATRDNQGRVLIGTDLHSIRHRSG